MRIVIASENISKIKEFKAILEPLGFELQSAKELEVDMTSVVEDGLTYGDNARIKAKFLFEKTGYLSVADDSGLSIEALPDILGVQSARFMGHDTPYKDKNTEILKMMNGINFRQAAFHSAIAVYGVDTDLLFIGRCDGAIGTEIKGHDGFGYDPIFIPTGYDKSFAELDSDTKNTISHRAIALLKMNEYFKKKHHEE